MEQKIMKRNFNQLTSTNYEKDYFTSKKISRYGDYQKLQNSRSHQDLLDLILSQKAGGNLLEIGCAYGFFLKHAENYFNSTGIDISNFAIKKAKNNCLKSNLSVGDIETEIDKYPNNYFDVIVAIDVLEHLQNPSLLLSKISKKLKKGGLIFFRVPNKSSLIYYLSKFPGMSNSWCGNQDKTHISLYSVNKWINIINKNGFNCRTYSAIPSYFMRTLLNSIGIKKIFYQNLFLPFNLNVIFLCKKL